MPLHHWTNQIKSMSRTSASRKPKSSRRSVLALPRRNPAPSTPSRDLTFLGIPDTVETRLRRFISNPRIDMAEYCENLAVSVIRAMPRKKPVMLLVDETSLHDRLKAMAVSVACEGRAIRGGDDYVPSD